jgi:hypothetical protein
MNDPVKSKVINHILCWSNAVHTTKYLDSECLDDLNGKYVKEEIKSVLKSALISRHGQEQGIKLFNKLAFPA